MVRPSEHAQQTFHVVQRVLRFMTDRLHGLPGQRRIVGARVPAPIGLDDDDRQCVRHHVMHVTRDAGAFGERRDMAFLIFFCLQGVVALMHHADGDAPGPLPVRDDDRREQIHGDEDEYGH